MADDFGVYDLTARLEATISSSIYGALDPLSGNMNARRLPERHVRDLNEISAVRNSPTNFMNVFVIPEVSSSYHEITSLNTYLSGTELLEAVVVTGSVSGSYSVQLDPLGASRRNYYSKSRKLVKLVYALTASAALPEVPTNEQTPATDEYPSRGLGTYHAISGSYRNCSIFNPSEFSIDVPEHGKIRDIRVWVEYINDHRGGGNNQEKQGLGGVQIALRSPNVSFKYAHPLWNDKTVDTFQKWPSTDVNEQYKGVPELLKNSYLLWAGHRCEEDLGYALGSQTGSSDTNGFVTRAINSSAFGPGISGSTDQNPSDTDRYLGGSTCYRSLSSIRQSSKSTFVLYPTLLSPTVQTMASISDDGTLDESSLLANYQTLFTGSYSQKFKCPRIRKQRLSDKVHASCLNEGISVVYGQKQIGDSNAYKWKLKAPVVVYGTQGATTSLTYGTPGPTYFGYPFGLYRDQLITGFTGVYSVGTQITLAGATNPNNNGTYNIVGWTKDSSGMVTGVTIQKLAAVAGAAEGPVSITWSIPCYQNIWPDIHVGPYTVGGDCFHDMAIDSNGRPHFVTCQWRGDLGLNALAYWFHTGSTCEYNSLPTPNATVTSPTTAREYQHYLVPVTDVGDLYRDVMFGQLDNPFIQSENSVVAPGVGAYCKIEIDKSDMIHVVYSDMSNRSVKYAKKQVKYEQWSGSWSYQLIHTHSLSSTYPTYVSLDIDDNDNPHVAYSLYDGLFENIYYAKSGSGGWALERVAVIPGSVTYGTNIKLDNAGSPVIVTTVSNYDGKGNEGVLLFNSSSTEGWTRNLIYIKSWDDPRDTTMTFDVNNMPNVYTGGNRLAAQWKTSVPRQGKYNEFDRDIDMRTTFSDSSNNMNPRNISSLYKNPKDSGPGESGVHGSVVRNNHAYSSPFSASINILQAAGMWGSLASHIFDPELDRTNHLTGANCPWFLDDRVNPGIFDVLKGTTYYSPSGPISGTLGLSPPPGWLTGPGSTANVNEFQTYGANLGPADIQPVYPLLDDIYVEKMSDEKWLNTNVSADGKNKILPSSHNKIVGFRPGLRGTEINGKWKLLVGVAGDVTGGSPGNVVGNTRAGIWFRQLRLEFLVDQGEDTKHAYSGMSRKYANPGAAYKDGNRRIAVISGSSAWDVGINYVHSYSPVQYGRSFGITSSTGSTDFAVFAQLTGSYVDILSGSGRLDQVNSTFINNEFGTPYIPVSSGSAEIPSYSPFSVDEVKESRRIFQETLNPNTLVPRDNTLRAHLARSEVIMSTRDTILRKVESGLYSTKL